MIRTSQAATALRTVVPSRAQMPVPESNIYAVAVHMANGDFPLLGFMTIVAHHCCLRGGYLSRVRGSHVAPATEANGLGAQLTITLRSIERGMRSKVRGFDEGMVVDIAWISRLLAKLKRKLPRAPP